MFRLLIVMFFAALISPAFGQGEPDVASFLDEFSANRNDIVQLKAQFTQTTVSPDETVTSTGTVVYARMDEDADGIHGKRLIFRYDEPPLEYMIDGLTAYEYDPELQQIQIFELEDRPEAEAFYLGFGSDTQRLTEAYAVRVQAPAETNPGGAAVALIPKDPESDEALFEMIVLQLRAGDLLPIQIHIFNDAESETAYDVTGFEIAQELDPAVTTIRVPEGTAIVDQDEYAGTATEGGQSFPLPDTNEPGVVDSEELEEIRNP